MKLRNLSTTVLRGMLLVDAFELLPKLRTAILDELAERGIDEREKRQPWFVAARVQADLRADGHACWLGIGGDS